MALNGYEKAAMFLTSLGESTAAEILKNLDADMIGKISSQMAKSRKTDRSEMEHIFVEVSEKISDGAFQVGGQEFVRKMLTSGLGDEDAEKILEMVEKESPLDSLKWVDAKTLTNFLINEHPQTIALILCLLESEQASEVIANLPEEIRGNVSMRVASTEKIPESALHEIEEVLKVQLDMSKSKEGRSFNGTQVIAEILNHCDRSMEQDIIDSINEENAEMAESIQELMLTFDDLEKIDDRGIQMIMKELSTEDLSLALKTATEGLKEKIFGNMSQRAAKILKDEMESKGPVKVTEVEAAQRNIIKVAKKLDEEGQIVIAGRGGEELIE